MTNYSHEKKVVAPAATFKMKMQQTIENIEEE